MRAALAGPGPGADRPAGGGRGRGRGAGRGDWPRPGVVVEAVGGSTDALQGRAVAPATLFWPRPRPRVASAVAKVLVERRARRRWHKSGGDEPILRVVTARQSRQGL